MKISGYITLRNPVEMDYPFEAAIRSLFPFCNEVVVCNTSDGKDGTENILKRLRQEFTNIETWKGDFKIVKPDFVDWTAPNHGIFDGQCKAFARSACTGDYLFQLDADEVVDSTREQMEQMCERLGKDDGSAGIDLLALPVVEFWGSQGKVRIDVNPWKWRLSKNKDYITHGIPGHLQTIQNGLLYATPGTDGCDYIENKTLTPIPCMNFVTEEVEQVRRAAVVSQPHADIYGKWFNKMTERLPTVYHFSWWSVYEKMRKYKLFWNNSWQSLYNEQRPVGYNPFFDKPFSKVTSTEMKSVANELEDKCGGFIFHKPVPKIIMPTNHVNINRPFPALANDWANKHKRKTKKENESK